jgi:ribonuclease BN (tRNA processing enzyme)
MHNMSRRNFLKGAGALAAAPFMTGLGGNALAASPSSVITNGGSGNYHTKLVLLGTAGGPTWWPECDRVSNSSAIVVGDTIYLIDLGHGATHRLAQAFNSGVFVSTRNDKVEKGYPTFLQKVDALFFTHLHMDHTSDYPALLLVGYGAGLGQVKPMKVIGPGDRGQLENFSLAGIPGCNYPGIIYTDSGTPTPGTKEMTKYIWQAYAQTINDFTLDDGWPDFRNLVEVADIGWTEGSDILLPLPTVVDPTNPCSGFIDPNTTPCVAMEPFKVYPDPDKGVTVSATLVDHHQVFPSFAFRFDTPDGSVVISGDTGPNTCDNLKRLAHGAEILVHEVIDQAWIDLTFGPVDKQTPRAHALYTHLMNSHTTIDAVGGVAEDAGVKTLVLSHIVPGNTPISHLQRVKKNFSGELIIGQDLMQIGVSKPRRRKA